MDTENRNSFGLFDAARRSSEKERVALTQLTLNGSLTRARFS